MANKQMRQWARPLPESRELRRKNDAASRLLGPGYEAVLILGSSKNKGPAINRASVSYAETLRERLLESLLYFRDRGFDRLVGLLGEIGIEFADLGCLGNEAFIRGLEVFALHFDRRIERLRAEQLLERGRALLERLL